jgi:hypothetical protein
MRYEVRQVREGSLATLVPNFKFHLRRQLCSISKRWSRARDFDLDVRGSLPFDLQKS